jgi:hypothetical protein
VRSVRHISRILLIFSALFATQRIRPNDSSFCGFENPADDAPIAIFIKIVAMNLSAIGWI